MMEKMAIANNILVKKFTGRENVTHFVTERRALLKYVSPK